MRQEDFYSGEPIIQGSPPNPTTSDEIQAAQYASFGSYYYSPDSRIMNQPIYNNQQMYGQQQWQQQPNYGLGSPYRYDMYGQPTNYQQQYYQQPYYQQQYQQQPTTYHIPGINITGSLYSYPADLEDRLAKLEEKMFDMYIDGEVKAEIDNRNNPYYIGNNMNYNYYGVPFYSSYNQNNITAVYNAEIEKIKQEAYEANIVKNIKLMKMACHICGQDISDEDIEALCRGRDVQIDQYVDCDYNLQKEYRDSIRYSRLIPIDPTAAFRNHVDAVDRQIKKYIPQDGNASNCYDKLGLLYSEWEMEEEAKRRINASNHYNNNKFIESLKKAKRERYYKEHNIILDDNDKEMQMVDFANRFDPNELRKQALSMMPELNECATIGEDGTLHITCNFGSHNGEVYSVHNSQESEYEQKRQRFGRFVDSIPGAIYQNNHEGGNG